MGCFSASETKSQRTADSKTKKQREGVDKALDVYLPELGKGANIFPDSRVAPFSTLQKTAISGAANYVDYFSSGPENVGTPLFNETGDAIKGVLSGETGAAPLSDIDTASYFDRAIKDPTMKGFREDVVPGIQEAFSGPGFWGSARSQELSNASQDVNEYLGSQRANLEWDVLGRNQQLEENRAGRTLTAIPQAMNYSQLPAQEIKNNLSIAAQKLGGLATVLGIGQVEQSQAQRELEDEIIRFAEENSLTDPESLTIIMGLLGLNFSQSQSSGSRSGPGLGYVAAQSGLSALGDAGAKALIASDARVKENIRPFGDPLEILRKLKPVTYNYVGQEDRRLGLIAQDIEEVLPEAVTEVDGIKHVDLYAIQTLIISAMIELLGDK